MSPFQSLVTSLAVNGITDNASIYAIAAERNIEVVEFDNSPAAPAPVAEVPVEEAEVVAASVAEVTE